MSQSRIAEHSSAPSPLYRAIWRWHFYAGLLVIPFMILLALTGGIYLIKDEFNRALYGQYLMVEPQSGAPLSPEDLLARALTAVPGSASAYLPPDSDEASAVIAIKGETGEKLRVYLNPYSGEVLGMLENSGSARSPIMLLIRKIHSLDYFGCVANRVIELVAGWAIVLVASGIYLWWPRGKDVGTFKIRSGARKRPFWRDLHAVTGIYTGLFIVFLSITGLPWSGYWGKHVNTYIDQAGLGYPPEFWNEVPISTVPMKDAMTQTSWSLENAPMPQSTPGDGAPIGLTQAVAIFDGIGVHKGYTIDLPSGEAGVYSASVFPDDVVDERVVHVDQYSGKVLFDGGFDALGPLAKAVEWGISVHMGQEYGTLNQLVMAGACIAIVLMSVSGIVMWWQRRPAGTLGAPRYPGDYRVARGAILILAVLGILFPLTGLSILFALLLDVLWPKALRPRLA